MSVTDEVGRKVGQSQRRAAPRQGGGTGHRARHQHWRAPGWPARKKVLMLTTIKAEKAAERTIRWKML